MDYSAFKQLAALERVKLLRRALEGVTNPSDVFGADSQKVKTVHKRLAKLIHPDLVEGDDVDATAATAKLNELLSQANDQIAAGSYGESISPANWQPIQVMGQQYNLVSLLGTGDISDVFLATDPDDHLVAVKIVHDAGDNDLMDNEARVLDRLEKSPKYEDMHQWFPQLVVQGYDKAKRRITILSHDPAYIETPAELATLKQVVEGQGGKLDQRHIGWIWRKIVAGMGFAHRNGVIHTALTPDNLLITVNPERHGVVLADWVQASVDQSDLVGISEYWREQDIYPENVEINEKVKPLPSLDVYMAAKSMLWACPDMHDALKRYFNWCIQEPTLARPDSFNQLLEQFDRIIFEVLQWPHEFIRLHHNTTKLDWSWFQQ